MHARDNVCAYDTIRADEGAHFTVPAYGSVRDCDIACAYDTVYVHVTVSVILTLPVQVTLSVHATVSVIVSLSVIVTLSVHM